MKTMNDTVLATKVLACFPEGTSNEHIKGVLEALIKAIEYGMLKDIILNDKQFVQAVQEIVRKE